MRQGSLSSEDSCHAMFCSVRGGPARPSGCGSVRVPRQASGRRLERVGGNCVAEQGWGGKDGRVWAPGALGMGGQSFQRRPQGRVVCARLCHSGSLVRDRGFSARRKDRGEAGAACSCWMESDSALWFQIWGFEAALSCRLSCSFLSSVCVCVLMSLVVRNLPCCAASPLVAASRACSWWRCTGFSLCWLLLLQGTGSKLSPRARGIFRDQGSNPRPLHWQVYSSPLCQQGSPKQGLT